MKVVVGQKCPPRVRTLLETAYEVVDVKPTDREDLKAKMADATALLIGTWTRIDKEIMDAAPQLKVIARTGVGYDNVDAEYACEKGIMVLNTPGANALSVAEHAVGMMCAAAKFFVYLDNEVRKGNFQSRREYLPVDLEGSTVGLIGLGMIGRLVAQKCKAAFNMKAIAYDPYLKEAPEGVQLLDTAEEVAKQADFLSLHMPLTDGTRNMVNSEFLSIMKKGSFLVNTSRGGIVDEAALVKAIDDGTIAGAALDVFASEPPAQDDPLLSCYKIILTPHTASLSKQCVENVAMCAAQGIVDFAKGDQPTFICNRDGLGL